MKVEPILASGFAAKKYIIESASKTHRRRVEVIIIKDKEILLTNIPAYPPIVTKDYFGFPGGGIDGMDSAIKTVKKETLEEIGVKLKNIKKMQIKPFIMEWDEAYKKKISLDKYAKRATIYSGTRTEYYIADYNGENKANFGHGQDYNEMTYEFVSIGQAIKTMDYLRKNFQNTTQRPIFNARWEVLNKIKTMI
jgi:8-oxo-dGTP pyrophosphatase MutT (NUDIX family)